MIFRAPILRLAIAVYLFETAICDIERDVAIVGGGAAGAHAAVRLRDEGYSIVLIEKESILVRPGQALHPSPN